MNSKKPDSRIPVLSPSPLRRSGSLRLGGCPPIKEHRSDVINQRPLLNRHRSLQSLNTMSPFGQEVEDDTGSVLSFSSVSGASVCSNMSQCDHAHFARNGTTYSGRSKRYVYHCSPHSMETDDYLTPTQRTNRIIRKLRNLLKEAQEELADKEKEIQRLTKEVVELRLLKADSGGEGDKDGGGGDAQPPATTPPPVTSGYSSSPLLAPSLSDSGHFDDLNSSHNVQSYISQIKALESSMESMQRKHEDEIRLLKEKQNDKVDSLLQRITDVNDRYYALRPLYEDCKVKLNELEKLNKELKNQPLPNHDTRIIELESLNESLLLDKKALLAEMDSLHKIKEELEIRRVNHDKLIEENMQLKSKQNELSALLNNMEKEESKLHINKNSEVDECSQTKVNDVFNGLSQETTTLERSQQTDHNSLLEENAELKNQIEAYNEKLKLLEEQQCKEKDIYVQLYEKGLQAAKMLDSEDIPSDQNGDSQSSLVPDLRQKLRVTQEELDNLKAMYRRLLESRKEQPKHDPEMTLQFLKSAFYYFLTDRENAPGHLTAIESILGFSDTEKLCIDTAFLWR